jgi:hypothetical protein
MSGIANFVHRRDKVNFIFFDFSIYKFILLHSEKFFRHVGTGSEQPASEAVSLFVDSYFNYNRTKLHENSAISKRMRNEKSFLQRKVALNFSDSTQAHKNIRQNL